MDPAPASALSRLRLILYRDTGRAIALVIDTQPRGPLGPAAERRWRPVISPAVALEYESVLKRGVGESGLSAPDIDVYIEYLCSQARLVQVYFRWRPMLPDPNEPRDVKDSRSRAA